MIREWWDFQPATLIKTLHKSIQIMRLKGITQTLHHTLIVSKVMNCIERRAQHLAAFVQVMQIRATVVLTGVAVTVRINGAWIRSIGRVS